MAWKMAESCSVHLRANLDYEQTCVVFDGIIALYSINIILHKQPFLQRIYISQKILIFFFFESAYSNNIGNIYYRTHI